jgi:hypothetical protein
MLLRSTLSLPERLLGHLLRLLQLTAFQHANIDKAIATPTAMAKYT